MEQALIKSDISKIPVHITQQQYQELRNLIKSKEYSNGKRSQFYKDRDLLLVDLCWELGGRIDDICHLTTQMINAKDKQIKLWTKKRKKWITIIVSDSLMLDLVNFISTYKIEDRLIAFSRQRAWQKVKDWGSDLGIKLHPHMFRHGNALFLMGKVPAPVISARLGHANTAITMSLYQKVTSELQKKFMEEINFR